MSRAGVVLGAFLLLATGCDDGDGEGSSADAGAALTAVTYNVGLLDSVGFVAQRAPLAIDATTKLDTDLLCVQEVWEQAHWDALVAAHAVKHPHVQRVPPDPGAPGQCVPDQFNPLQICAQRACAQSDNLVACVLASCAAEVALLDSGCQTCLLTNAPSGSFDTIRGACVGSAAAGAAGRSYVSGGSYGIGLLSAQAFSATDQRVLNSSTVRRAILYGRLDDAELGSVHVFCTHLSAIQAGLKYDGSYGDWDGENAAHVQSLIDYATEKAGADGKILILGDLNTSPAGPGILPSVPANYAKLPAAGFANAFLSGPTAACTFCTDNPLVVSTDTGAGALLDHILTRGIGKSVTVTRQLDTLIDLDVMQPSGALEKRRVGLSDHYGLRAAIAR